MSMQGCGEMEYCTGGSNGNVCTNKRGVNQACEHNVQCISGSCRHGKCRNDACPMIDTSIDCMPTQYCTSSPQGHMCVSKKENGARCAVSTHCRSGVCEHGVCVQDDCWKPFTQDRCQTSHYCSPGTKGHTCEMKRMLGASCRFDVQCKSHMCRHRMCMTDKCSVPLSTDRCDVTTEFCQAGPTGNMCVTKLMDMTSCKVNVQCMSGRCLNGMCVPKTPGKKPIGAACMMHKECETMWCVVSKCSVTQHSVGGRCLVNSDCQSNICGPMMTCEALTTTTVTTPTTTATTPTTAATTAATTTTTMDSTTMMMDTTTMMMDTTTMMMATTTIMAG
ncbi:integumentary mucin C.1-like [Amphibalanus amphitrite]|uniref:integumentary mucin C.1-like n=1 Tax=Amphibalanus amphitrite TaxID=1232801 RepID=UPI001C926B95|nr:integumentary mucin C.1-like [Amphibalanus amphitrite]